jgi:hypothetical protein
VPAAAAAAQAATGAEAGDKGVGDMEEILGVMEALGQQPNVDAGATSDSSAPPSAGRTGAAPSACRAPSHSAESPTRHARQKRAGGAVEQSPRAAAAAALGRDEAGHDAFYQAWRVKQHRPSSPDFKYSQAASEGAMVRLTGGGGGLP